LLSISAGARDWVDLAKQIPCDPLAFSLLFHEPLQILTQAHDLTKLITCTNKKLHESWTPNQKLTIKNNKKTYTPQSVKERKNGEEKIELATLVRLR
jgi:hypothetical protein